MCYKVYWLSGWLQNTVWIMKGKSANFDPGLNKPKSSKKLLRQIVFIVQDVSDPEDPGSSGFFIFQNNFR